MVWGKICGKELQMNIIKPCYSNYIFPVSWLFIISKFHCTRFSLRAGHQANFNHLEKVFVVKRFRQKLVVFLLKMPMKPLKLMARRIIYFLMRLLLRHCTIIMHAYNLQCIPQFYKSTQCKKFLSSLARQGNKCSFSLK